MPQASALMHAAAWSQLLPPAALAFGGRLGVRPRVLIGLAMATSVVGDLIQLMLGRQSINNLWVGYISTAVTGILVILGLSFWAPTLRGSRTIRLALIAYVLVWATLVFENVKGFSVVTIPVHSLMVLMISLWIVIGNALEDHPLPLNRSDWFWAGLGLALLYGALSAVQPLLNVLLAQKLVGQAVLVLNAKAFIQIVAVLMIVIGMLCPTPRPSGPSFSPAR
jgi:hypothetical protein